MPPEVRRLPRLRPPLRTPRLVLRSPLPRDAREIARWLSDRQVTRTVPLWPNYTGQDARDFVRHARSTLRAGTSYLLAVTLAGTGEYVGNAGLEVRSAKDRRGHLGYWIARPHWGHGYASEAASRLCHEAFRTLRMHRLETSVVEGNLRSRAVLVRLGFRSEGVDRENFRIDGKYRDAERFGLLSREFRPYVPPPTPRPPP